MATTEYGSWNNHGDKFEATLEASVGSAMNGGGSDWCRRMDESGAVEKICLEYREAINKALPDGVVLAGDLFYGPYGEYEDLDIHAIVESIDLMAIIERHDVDA